MDSVMLDLETLGVGNNAVIISIGAVQFDLSRDDQLGEKYYRNVDADSCVKLGLSVSGGTIVDFWFHQSDEARHVLLKDRKDLKTACHEFNDYLKRNKISEIWGNGSTFDCTIIRSAFDAAGVGFPLPFWADRDMRTLIDLAKRLGIDVKKPERVGVAHNALDDALFQVSYVTKVFRQIKGSMA